MRSNLILGAVFLAAVLTYFSTRGNQGIESPSSHESAPAPHTEVSSAPPESTVSARPTRIVPHLTAKPAEAPGGGTAPLSASLPSSASIRADFARDPESPSRSVISFSIDLERKNEVASQSEETATEFFKELEECASGGGKVRPAEAAQVLCLKNASELAEKYPSLREGYANLEGQVAPRVRQLKKMMTK